MPMFTQAAQTRLAQRPADTGRWVVPEVIIEEYDGTEWMDASEWFETMHCGMTSVGGSVLFEFAAIRTRDTNGSIYRLSFPEREDTITTAQKVGELVIVHNVEDTEDDRVWAVYPLVGTPSGRLETLAPFDYLWPTAAAGDVVQFSGTWFI